MFNVSKQRQSLKYWIHKRFWKFHVSFLINMRVIKTRMDTFDFVNDPITAAQVKTLACLLGDQWSKKARYGFLVIAGRFVGRVGHRPNRGTGQDVRDADGGRKICSAA